MGAAGDSREGVKDQRGAAWEGVSKQARWPRKKLSFSSILPDFSSCPPNQFPSCIVLNLSAQQPVPSLPNQISSGHPCAQNHPLRPHSTWDKAHMVGGSSPLHLPVFSLSCEHASLCPECPQYRNVLPSAPLCPAGSFTTLKAQLRFAPRERRSLTTPTSCPPRGSPRLTAAAPRDPGAPWGSTVPST